MANEFIKKEVEKIISDASLEFPRNHALAAAWILANFKGTNIKIYDVQGTSSLCDYNIVASASNVNQARAMVDEILFNLKRHGATSLSVEGLNSGDWILLDLGDIIVHIFQDVSRDIYDLDTLWAKYPQVEIPNNYYFANAEVQVPDDSGNTDNYF